MTAPEDTEAQRLPGVVLETVGGIYQVGLDEGSTIQASLRGRLKQEFRLGDRVVAGDRVEVERGDDGSLTIEAVHPRRTRLVRAGPGGRKPKVVAANVDRLAAVMAADHPAFRPETADRFLVLGEVCGLEPVLVINKMDLPGADALGPSLEERYRAAGYPILLASVESGRGIPEFRDLLSRGITILAGPSGVGKSSLLNAIAPGLKLRTGEVSRREGRGKHTTVSARLLELPGGGWVVDTPGFSEVEFWSLEPMDLARAFPEFRDLAHECRFRSCTHLHEPDCAVQEALEVGAVDASRFASYRQLSSSA